MKKILIMLVLAAMCGATAAQAQRYFIPKYKKKKEVRDYDMSNSERRWTVTFGGSYNMALGMRNRIRFGDRDYTVRYYEDPSLSGGAVNLGVGYKFTDNIVAGLEAGYLFQDNDDAIPIYGTFNYYYGPSTSTRRHRWFNYAHLGPQFYFNRSSKAVGAMGAVGGGVRVLLAKSMKVDFRIGYQLNMRRPNIADGGSYDLPASGVNFKQYTHVLELGVNIVLF